jgi:hypothetical protein
MYNCLESWFKEFFVKKFHGLIVKKEISNIILTIIIIMDENELC